MNKMIHIFFNKTTYIYLKDKVHLTYTLPENAIVSTYPWPDMPDFCSDYRFLRILVAVPILTTFVYHTTVGAFQNIPKTKVQHDQYIHCYKSEYKYSEHT